MLVKRLVLGASFALLLFFATGCAQQRPVVDKISVDIEKKDKMQNISIYPTDRASLKEVNLEIKVIFDDGGARDFKKYFANWDETRVIEVPVLSKIEKIQVLGTGFRVFKAPDGKLVGEPVDIRYERAY